MLQLLQWHPSLAVTAAEDEDIRGHVAVWKGIEVSR
jgi:hypothetical protein